MSINTLHEPNTYVEANKFECWNQAMEVELSSLKRIYTWEIVESPPNIKPICFKWIYKIIFYADGSGEGFKD